MNESFRHTLVALALFALTMPARAGYEQMYGIYFGTELFRTDTVGLWYAGAGTANKMVVCPVVRQHATNSGGIYNIHIKVRSHGGRTLT